MKLSSIQKAVALGAAAAFVLTAGAARSQTLGDEDSCRANIAKSVSKLSSAAHKAQVTCVKNVLNAKAPQFPLGPGEKCHQMSTADVSAKVSGANTSLQNAVPGTKCAGTMTVSLGPTGYVGAGSCQVGVAGAPAAVVDFDDVSDCLGAAATGAAELLFGEILNPDFDAIAAAPNQGDLEKCVNSIAKNATKAVATIHKERTKAQNGIEKNNVAAVASYTFPPSVNTKINDAIGKINSGIDDNCTPAEGVDTSDLILLGTCGTSVANIKTCIENAVRDTGEGLASMMYVNASEFPVRADVFINAGTTNGSNASALNGVIGTRRNRTQLDAGFKGLGHRVDVIDGFEGAVELNCGGDGICDVDASCVKNNCRCSNDITDLCDEPFVVDVDDCGAGTCQVFFGPPLDLSAGGTPTCVVNRIDALAGTVDLANGNSNTTVDNTSLVHLDEDGQNQPCPKCVGGGEVFGAVGFNDGTRSGTCDGGGGYPSQGNPCDANGFSTTFGNTSYDCPPNPGKNISGAGLDITLNISDEPPDLGAGTTTCGGSLPGLDCHCRVCLLTPTVPCSSNADCTGGGNTCTGTTGSSPQVEPNGCASDLYNCPADGECALDSATYCDGFLRGDGRGIFPCLNDGSCVTIAGECPGGDCGTCTLTEPLPCFPPVINASSVTNSGSEHAVLAANFCIPPTGNLGVNTAAGTPGPGRVTIDFNFDILCDDNTTEAIYGGINCP